MDAILVDLKRLSIMFRVVPGETWHGIPGPEMYMRALLDECSLFRT